MSIEANFATETDLNEWIDRGSNPNLKREWVRKAVWESINLYQYTKIRPLLLKLLVEHQQPKFLAHCFTIPNSVQVLCGGKALEYKPLKTSYERFFSLHGATGGVIDQDNDYSVKNAYGVAIFEDAVFDEIASPEISEDEWKGVRQLLQGKNWKKNSDELGKFVHTTNGKKIDDVHNVENEIIRPLQSIDAVRNVTYPEGYTQRERPYIDTGTSEVGFRFAKLTADKNIEPLSISLQKIKYLAIIHRDPNRYEFTYEIVKE